MIKKLLDNRWVFVLVGVMIFSALSDLLSWLSHTPKAEAMGIILAGVGLSLAYDQEHKNG